jgi:hypothetical protein
MSNLENMNLKKSFALLTTIILVMLFSFISIRLIETNLLSSNLNKLKYLHLQANIYIDRMSKYIISHNDLEIYEYKNNWQDERFSINIIKDENNDSIYYISIKTSDNSHVRLSQKIIK